MNDLVPIYHRFCQSDNRVAFYYTHTPVPGEIVSASLATKLDGTRPVPAEQIICGSCNRAVTIQELVPKFEDTDNKKFFQDIREQSKRIHERIDLVCKQWYSIGR